MPDAMSIPLALRHALEAGECVLFVGAGIGGHLSGPDGSHAPDAPGLAQELAKHFGLDTTSVDLAKVSQLVEIRKSRDALEDFLRRRFADLTPDDTLTWLFSRRWRAIFTTNYDRGIARAYELLPAPLQNPIPIAATSQLVAYDPRFEIPIYHIHGALFGNRSSVVITQSDYARFQERRRMLFELLKKEFATSTILYVGYSNSDPNWNVLVHEIAAEFEPAHPPQSFRVAPSTDPVDVEILRARGVETISATLQEFVAIATLQLDKLQVDVNRLKALQTVVPTHLLAAFEANPAPVARLLASWEYVNQAPFADPPNTRAFVRGDRANWSLVATEGAFTRDVEPDIYDDILDYVTVDAKHPTVILLLGPAGYGVSTTLMNLSARLVKERVGPVFFLRSTASLLEGDVEFAIGLHEGVTCFVIDNIADNARALQSIVARLREAARPALFVCGERLNEWRQRNVRVSGKEYLLEPLSEPEIDRLLDCLAKHNELNQLEPLSRDLQKAVIKEKHGKELLVALREATEGKQFDGILEDEFRGIDDDKCREIYLTVCCFYQHGSLIRDHLLSEIVDVPLTDFHARTKGKLDGVVVDECIDVAANQYASRARHRTIATIIWERCGERNEKDRLLQLGLDNLNLNYKVDLQAFEKFVRNDWLIDSIRGLDNKIRFFESACKKDPDNPYVRQHYARMLLRERKLELALSQIETGLTLDAKNPPRVLFHTKGTILGELALQSENIDIARRRLAQAEDAFRKLIALNPRDDYAYQALATLYLNWAKQCPDDQESALYLSRAEEAIADGLKRCRVRDALWVVSAEIEHWLGDQPSRLKALETAVRETPGSIIPRYLLGRMYRALGRLEDCIVTLEPNIKNHPDEFRSCVEYSLALRDQGRPLRDCIAVLRISSVLGLSDAWYIAHLGGLYFLNQQFPDAAAVFKESSQRELPEAELRNVPFRPLDPAAKQPMTLTGRVVRTGSTYSWIEVEGYPQFFCPRTQYREIVLRQGMKVRFQVGFSARGQIALSVTAAA